MGDGLMHPVCLPVLVIVIRLQLKQLLQVFGSFRPQGFVGGGSKKDAVILGVVHQVQMTFRTQYLGCYSGINDEVAV